MSELVERLREHATDWDGSQMDDREPAKGDPTAGTLREAAARIEALEAQLAQARKASMKAEIERALEIARRYGQIEGDHHRAWVIDQMVRALTGEDYEAWIADAKQGEDGPDTYSWDEGIAP